jgi:hypothetical protein
MANFVFNIAKGRAVELYNRVDTSDPSTSRLIVMALEAAGLETQANLEDSLSFTEVLDGTTNEQVTVGRKTLTNTDLATFTNDTTNNRNDLDLADQTWAGATGNAIGALVIGYIPISGGADSTIIPISHHDFAVTPDGSDITAQISVFFRAS